MADDRKKPTKPANPKDDDLEVTEASPTLEALKKAGKPTEPDDEIMEVVEVVEEEDDVVELVEEEAPTVLNESDIDFADVDIVEVEEDSAKDRPPSSASSLPAAPKDTLAEMPSDDALATLDEIEVVGSSMRVVDSPLVEESPLLSDFVSQKPESDINLEPAAASVPPSAKAKKPSDSDIDLESILSEADDSSAVNLTASGHHKTQPSSDKQDSKAEFTSTADSGDAEMVRKEDLLATSEAAGIDDDEILLVTPKKSPDGDFEEVFEAPEAISDSAEPQKPAKKRELVGAGAGGKQRGGFMPFLFGGMLATVVVAGGAAAAWYFNYVPESPTAEKKAAPRPATPQTIIGKTDEQFEQLQNEKDKADSQYKTLQKVLAEAKLPGQADKLREHVESLETAKSEAEKKLADAMEAMAKGGKAGEDVEELRKAKAKADADVAALQTALADAKLPTDADKLKQHVEGVMADKAAAEKNFAELKTQVDSLVADKAAADKSLADIKDVLAKAGDLPQKVVTLSAERDKLAKEREAALNERDVMARDNEAAAKARDELAKEVDGLKTSLESAKQELALAMAKDPDAGAKAREALTKEVESLKAALEIASKQLDAAKAAPQPALRDDLAIAEALIKNPDPKAQGQGYIILGAAQSNAGKTKEGLDNIVKGLKLVNPAAMTALGHGDVKAPLIKAPMPEVLAPEPNPLKADKHYTKGLESFWSRNYVTAESEFAKAVTAFNDDARYHYFLGMSRYMQGSSVKRKLAAIDLANGAQLETARQPTLSEINASLERVQGDLRAILNSYRDRKP